MLKSQKKSIKTQKTSHKPTQHSKIRPKKQTKTLRHSSPTSTSHRNITSSLSQSPLVTNNGVETIVATRLDLDRSNVDKLALQKMIFVQSYEIYGGAQGLYDYGPTGSAVMSNIRTQWRKQFIKAERMLEFSGSTLTPEAVLRSSGHLERFTDWMTSTREPELITQNDKDTVVPVVGKDKGKKKKGDFGNGSETGPKPFESEHIRTDKIVEDSLDDLIDTLTKIKVDGKITAEQEVLLGAAIQDRALVGGMNGAQLDSLVQKYSITHNGNPLNPSHPFNLMFATQFGPSGKQPYYFRPETAQGIFVNFARLFHQNNNQLPFSVAQVGTAYRNEISPRNGILRTREFTQAEIEHFVDPNNKLHPKFTDISTQTATFLSAQQQLDIANGVKYETTVPGSTKLNENGEILTFEEAVYGNALNTAHNKGKVVDNETLGYFLAKTLNFLTSIGVHANKIRFRQHLPTEMAHYATDCWDAEILTTFGWVECVGHADRSAHDLSVHAAATKTELSASKMLDPPEINRFLKCMGNKGKLIPVLKQKYNLSPDQVAKVMQFVTTASQDALEKTVEAMVKAAKERGFEAPNNDWSTFDFIANPVEITIPLYGVDDDFNLTITSDLLNLSQQEEKIHIKHFTPHVIEPSFGLARIFYSVLEHSFDQRPEDEQRKIFKFKPEIAPYQVALYPVTGNLSGAKPVIRHLERQAIDLDMAVQIDESKTSIGKKYSRWDENGIPFAITIDAQSVQTDQNDQNDQNDQKNDHHTTKPMCTVTIRERDSCEQIRLDLDLAMGVVHDLVKGRTTWDGVTQRFGKLNHNQDENSASQH